MERTATQVATDGAFQIRRPLDALNFFLADVRDGLGPYLAIYLLMVQRWDEASIGLVMSVATLAGLLAQTPCPCRKTYALRYWWCSPPRTGTASVRPMVWTARGIGGSLCSDRCVRASL